VVVEHRHVQLFAQPVLDLEAARGGDVLEVDAGEHRGDDLHRPNDLVHVLGVQADRERVDPGEPLEQGRFALHHRQCGGSADVAEPEHRRPVGDHSDRVALDGQPDGVLRVRGELLTDPAHTRGVDQGEVVAVPDLHLRLDLDLAAEVGEEGAVRDTTDHHSGDGAQRVHDLLGLVLTTGGAGDVHLQPVHTGGGDVHCGDHTAGVLHGGGDRAHRG